MPAKKGCCCFVTALTARQQRLLPRARQRCRADCPIVSPHEASGKQCNEPDQWEAASRGTLKKSGCILFHIGNRRRAGVARPAATASRCPPLVHYRRRRPGGRTQSRGETAHQTADDNPRTLPGGRNQSQKADDWCAGGRDENSAPASMRRSSHPPCRQQVVTESLGHSPHGAGHCVPTGELHVTDDGFAAEPIRMRQSLLMSLRK